MILNILAPAPSFADVVRRMTTGDPRHPRPVAWTLAQNICTDDPRIATFIMSATAELSARCLRPAYAFTIGWHADENPTPDAMRTVTLATLDRAGLADHQALLICPADRVHPCVRVVVNRVHPETGRAWSTSHDYRRFERIMKDLAVEHGVRAVPSRRQADMATV